MINGFNPDMQIFHRPNPVRGSRPHDLFIRLALAILECAGDLCWLAFSNSIRRLNLAKLSFKSPELFNPDYEERRVDKLLSVPFDNDEVLNILVEHKSYDDPHVMDQVYEYIRAIYASKEAGTDQAIVIILSNCENGWKQDLCEQADEDLDVLDNLKLRISFKTIVVDVFDKSLESRISECATEVVWKLMREIWNLSDEKVSEHLQMLDKMPGELRNSLIPIVMDYIRRCYPQAYNIDRLKEIRKQVIKNSKEEFDMYEEHYAIWKQEGVHEGIEKGIEKGVKKVAGRLLQEGADHDLISKCTGLSKRQIKGLVNGSGNSGSRL